MQSFIRNMRDERKRLVSQWYTYVRAGVPNKYGTNDRIYNSQASIMIGRIRMLTDILADEDEFYKLFPYLGPINVQMPPER